MKTRIILIASVLLALSSCGTTASLSSGVSHQKFQDGIYYRPQSTSLDEYAAKLTAADELIDETRTSAVFVKTIGKVDTLFIPDNMNATFKFDHKDNTTTLSLYENDYDSWLYRNTPVFGWHSWYSPFYYFPWRSSLWYHRTWGLGWYDPFWYDPFWSVGWYDPFWFDPFFYDPFWYDPFFYHGYGYGYAGLYFGMPYYSSYYPYWIRGGGGPVYGHSHYGDLATRGESQPRVSQPRNGVGRVVRTGGSTAAAAPSGTASRSVSRTVPTTASRPMSSSMRSTASVQRSAGTSSTASTGSASRSTVSRSNTSTVAGRSNTAPTSAPTASRNTYRVAGSSGGASRASSSGQSVSGGSYGGSTSYGRSSSSVSSPSRSSSSMSSSSRSSGSMSSPSRSAGGYSGGSSSGGFSGGGASRGGGSSSVGSSSAGRR